VVFSHQVDIYPAPVALLDVGQGERGDLRAAQAAAEESGEDGAVAHPLARGLVGCVQQALGVEA
jgi:hypothetical protein